MSANLTQSKTLSKLTMGRYLEELGQLSAVVITERNLLSIAETRQITDKVRTCDYALHATSSIFFSEIRQAKFAAFIRLMRGTNDEPITLWTPRSRNCGCALLSSLGEIRFDFSFDLIPEGILSVVTRSCSDRLLLDFTREASGREVLKVETYGAAWGRIGLSQSA